MRNGTETTEGFIPFLREARTGYLFPVKLDFSASLVGSGSALVSPNQLMPPKKDTKGFLVYALPGGGEFSDEVLQ